VIETIYRHSPANNSSSTSSIGRRYGWAAKTVRIPVVRRQRPGSRSWPKARSKARSAILPL